MGAWLPLARAARRRRGETKAGPTVRARTKKSNRRALRALPTACSRLAASCLAPLTPRLPTHTTPKRLRAIQARALCNVGEVAWPRPCGREPAREGQDTPATPRVRTRALHRQETKKTIMEKNALAPADDAQVRQVRRFQAAVQALGRAERAGVLLGRRGGGGDAHGEGRLGEGRGLCSSLAPSPSAADERVRTASGAHTQNKERVRNKGWRVARCSHLLSLAHNHSPSTSAQPARPPVAAAAAAAAAAPSTARRR
jgi:hypothetical protein